MQLICAFVFAFTKIWFSHDMANGDDYITELIRPKNNELISLLAELSTSLASLCAVVKK